MLCRYVCTYMGHDCIFQGPTADATTHACPLIPDKGYSPRVHSREHISVIANPLSVCVSPPPPFQTPGGSTLTLHRERVQTRREMVLGQVGFY